LRWRLKGGRLRENLVLNRCGKTGEARELFGRLAAQPQQNGTLATYAWLLNLQRRHEEAWQTVKRLKNWRQDPELLRLGAKTAFWAGENDAALEAWRLLSAARRRRRSDSIETGADPLAFVEF
jgi:Tfp pilus assembly protein PilF